MTAPALDLETPFCPAASLPQGGQVLEVAASDGAKLRAAFWPARVEAPRGTVAILPGRAEFIEKYGEVIGELLERGFAVAALDLRGQGGSQRELADPRKGHVDDFALYGLDVEALARAVLEPLAPRPWFGLAHSMAACACFAAALEGALPFARLVAIAPMVALYGPAHSKAARALTATLDALGFGAHYVPGGTDISAMTGVYEGNRLTRDPARFARNAELARACPALALGAPTIGWVAAAFRAMQAIAEPDAAARVAIPTLALLAGADRVVDARAAENFVSRLKVGLALTIPGARHEILMETDDARSQFWAAFDAFIPGERA